MLLIVASPGFFSWYYSNAWIEKIDGTTYIIREYGPLHNLYYVYLFGYLLADIAAIIWGAKKKTMRSKQFVAFLLAAVCCHVVIWLTEQFLPRGFEYLSVSYIMTELFLLLAYSMMQDYIKKYEKEAVKLINTAEFPKDNVVFIFTKENIDKIFTNCEELKKLTEREMEVLRELLADKMRKDIAEELHLSESSIKKYTSCIFKKLSVENRKELFIKLAYYIDL